MKYIYGFVWLFFPTLLVAQFLPNQADLIEKYSQTITGNDLHAHLSFLADDLLEGRETGTRGQKLAAAYIRAQFMRLGLAPGNVDEDSYFQNYYLRRTTINSVDIQVNDSSFEFYDDFFALKGQLPNRMGGSWEFVGLGLESDDFNNLKGVDLQGKVALMVAQSPEGSEEQPLGQQVDDWTRRADNLYKKGAAHVVMVLPAQAFNIIQAYSRMGGQDIAGSKEIPYGLLCISEDMGEFLIAQVAKKPEKVWDKLTESEKVPKVDMSQLNWELTADVDREYLPAENVLGYLEGTDKKDELLILTAHYDHIGIVRDRINNGADDDGSGTSAILELAEAFSKAAENGNRPRRSILFMTVSGEEKGLLGSKFYTDNPIYPLDQTITNLNIDMIGRIDKKFQERADSTNYVYLIGSDKLSSELHQISEDANKQFVQLTLDYTFNDENDPNKFYYRSDHYNFAKNNIPVIFYFTGVHEDYHKPTDDIPKIRLEKTAKITKLVFATAWELANRDKRIVVDSNKK